MNRATPSQVGVSGKAENPMHPKASKIKNQRWLLEIKNNNAPEKNIANPQVALASGRPCAAAANVNARIPKIQ